MRRWRLVLGSAGEEAERRGGAEGLLNARDAEIDAALAALYSPDEEGGLTGRRSAGSGASAPRVARWLGDIRQYFPASIVRVMQRDALDRLDLRQMLLEPEMLEAVEADVHLVASLISLSSVIPESTRASARAVVRKVVDALMKKLEEPMRSAVAGALDRSTRSRRRPRLAEIDWNRTLRANLRHYQPELGTVIPEQLIGYGRKSRRSERDIILAIDQSGSMAPSVVYSSLFGAVLASLPTVTTHLVAFDTEVVDLTARLEDPVDVLFGVQLGGGTFIHQAVGYCEGLVRRPADTLMVLISDLYEGGVEAELLQRTAGLLESGVQVIILLALSDEGAPAYDRDLAARLSALGAPSFACSPDLFPDMMAAAIRRRDLFQWAAERGIVTSRSAE
ncbi:MAG: VWA domain-containing protein [Acidobacteriota bacterium]